MKNTSCESIFQFITIPGYVSKAYQQVQMKEKVNVSLLVHDLSSAPRSLQKRFHVKHMFSCLQLKMFISHSNSGVHLLLAVLCRANGVALKPVNHWRSSCRATNTFLPLSLTLPVLMILSSRPRHSQEPSDLLQLPADTPQFKSVLMILKNLIRRIAQSLIRFPGTRWKTCSW